MEILTIYNSQEDFELGNVLRIVPFRICHFRAYARWADICNPEKVNLPRHGSTLMLPYGGTTQLTYISAESKIRMVTAHCSVNDRFSRPQGIKTCMAKFIQREYPERKLIGFYRPSGEDLDFAIVLGPINDNK